MTFGIRNRLLALLLSPPLLLATSACGTQPSANQADAGAANAMMQSSEVNPVERANRSLRAAAEPFEVVTEQAFTAGWDRLDRLIAEATAATRDAGSALHGAPEAAVERQLAAIRAARSAQDRIAIALAAVEAYRALVEAQDPGSASPPVEVSLLDYAGFRYDALAQSRAPDWQEMRRLTQFAGQQWRRIAPGVQSRALAGVVESTLGGMASAAERRDVAFARRAAAVELALVDLIEEQVALPRGNSDPSGSTNR